MSPDLGCCVRCVDVLERRGIGMFLLQEESDRMLHDVGPDLMQGLMPDPKCMHCGAKMMLNPNGTHPLWCNACERERRSYL